MDPVLVVLITLIIAVGATYFYLSRQQQQRRTERKRVQQQEQQHSRAENEEAEASSSSGDEYDEVDFSSWRRRREEEGEDSSSGLGSDDNDNNTGGRNTRLRLPAGRRTGTLRHNRHKAERTAAREERRLAQQSFLEEQRKKKEERLAREAEESKKEEMRERVEEETVAQLRQEAKQHRELEYNQWVGSIAVEEAGEMGTQEEMETEFEAALEAKVKEEKVCVLQELSQSLERPVDRVVEAIEKLVTEGTLSGVFDDRGKFMYIAPDEYGAIERFIRQRGRVSMPELVRECNRVLGSDERPPVGEHPTPGDTPATTGTRR